MAVAEELLNTVSNTVVQHFGQYNQRLWSFCVGGDTLKLDRIFHHQTETDQQSEELWWTMIMYYVSVFVAVTIVDFCFVRPLTFVFLKVIAKKPTAQLTRTSWLLLHALFNTYITTISLGEGLDCFLDPTVKTFEPARWWGSHPGGLLGAISIGAFHLQHFAFYEFTTEDIVHHLINAGLVVVIGALCPWGRITALSNFAMCGIPGALNYYMLWLRKGEIVSTKHQKKLNRFCNIVLRYPIQFVAAYAFTVLIFRNDTFPQVHWGTFAAMLVAMVAHTGNSLYYADQVVANYGVWAEGQKQQKRLSSASPSKAPGPNGSSNKEEKKHQ